MNLRNRNVLLAVGALLLILAGALGYSLTRTEDLGSKTSAALSADRDKDVQQACASEATYDRLKEVAFEEAIKIRNADPVNLDRLAASSVVRMERPVVKSRDEDLNVTVCSGRFILELPPGAERAFGGERRLVAEVEYAAQSAADGSGMVFELNGAEPIIYKLAAFDLRGNAAPLAPAAEPEETRFAEASMPPPVDERETAEPPAQPRPEPTPEPRQEPQPAPQRPQPAPRQKQPLPQEAPAPAPAWAEASARPSFNCRHAGSRSERMVCGSGRLARLDREMSSQFYTELARAGPGTRRELRRSRNRFLAYRDRCPNESCVAQAYRDRMDEIADIAASGE